MNFSQWIEATQPYTKKMVDPALLTQEELYQIINKEGKHHPSSAYRFSTNNPDLPKRGYYPILLQNRTINGIRFEFRVKKTDKTNRQYVKTTPSGDYLRDENNQLVYSTKDELLQRFKNNRYEYSVGVFDGEQYVGGCQDEWGCVLYKVANEYQNFGLGTILARIAWELEPGKTSGGFTNAGFNTFQNMHREAVKEYLQSGMYSHLIKTGQITKEKVKEIISSVKGSIPNNSFNKIPKTKTTNKNLNTNDPSDYLLMSHEGSFIIYDKKIKEVIDQEDYYWKFKMIKGIIYVEGSRIKIFGADTKELKKLLLLLAATEEEPIYVEPEDLDSVDQELMVVEPLSYKPGYKSHAIKLKQKINIPIKSMILKEIKFRRSFDKYDEFKIQVIELAYSKYQK